MFYSVAIQAAKAHAIREFPKESCGLVISGEYVPQPNVAADPTKEFQLPADAPHEFEAVIHSHCAPALINPSAADIKGQAETAVPWGIILTDGKMASSPLWWSDHLLDLPLIGRAFIHGVTDCYSVIESHWWQTKGVRLPVVPRSVDWWNGNENLYVDGFEAAGFRQIPEGEAALGDAVLLKIKSPVPNHAAVIVENGMILHHLQNRLSRREPLGNWRKFVTHYLRHEQR